MTPPNLRTVLFFPPHLSPNPTTLPLLTALQSLLNVSYTATYCLRPDIFGTSHLRIADPATFADIIGADGFTIVVFAVKSDQRRDPTESSDGDRAHAKRDGELAQMVATGSVMAVDDEDVRKRAQWASRAGRAAPGQERQGRNDSDSNSISAALGELNDKLQALYRERQNPVPIHELRAFAVSPTHRGLGLGARVLKTVEWLLGRDGVGVLDFSRGVHAPGSSGAHLSSSLRTEMGGQVHGVDLDEVMKVWDQNRIADFAGSEAKQLEKDTASGVECQLGHRKLRLVAIRELGNEGYYQRRGYKSLRTGILPLGTWGSNAECTTVYMEKSI
ncbi:hypothetical protein HO173_002487 [Letharia columbiana]|uniref:N-acetyltransferase domain-containing protein n=1 Tax=Letharia columbiana TaxID=112416 RepID=A0A8H6G2B8_9LECA|nr:uncharacterized protein HO173_002487 [Letharia columbiana]KAF6239226.1 hypothetical protein HO173_002487 [Letharia columbiana]